MGEKVGEGSLETGPGGGGGGGGGVKVKERSSLVRLLGMEDQQQLWGNKRMARVQTASLANRRTGKRRRAIHWSLAELVLWGVRWGV